MIHARIALFHLLVIAAPAVAEEWRPMFNGKDLADWTVKIKGHEAGDNFGDTFRVEDGLLKVRFDQYEGPFKRRFGHLFYKEPMSHYRLRVEYRVVGQQAEAGPQWAYRNSGVMIHGQSPESMRVDQDFPVSIEVQLLSREDPNANLCTPGTNVVMDGKLQTNHCISSSSEPCEGEDWVMVEVEVRGGEVVRHFVNGEQVLQYSEPQLDERDADARALMKAGAEKMLTGGTISLQSESHPVDFRKVEVMELAP